MKRLVIALLIAVAVCITVSGIAESANLLIGKASDPITLLDQAGITVKLIGTGTGDFADNRNFRLDFSVTLDAKYVIPSMDGYDAIMVPKNLIVGDQKIVDTQRWGYEMGLDAYSWTLQDGKYSGSAYMFLDNPEFLPVSFTLEVHQGVKATRANNKTDVVIVNISEYSYTGQPVSLTFSYPDSAIQADPVSLGMVGRNGPRVTLFEHDGIAVSVESKKKEWSFMNGGECLNLKITVDNKTNEKRAVVLQSVSQNGVIYETTDINPTAIAVDAQSSGSKTIGLVYEPLYYDTPLPDESDLTHVVFLFDVKKDGDSRWWYKNAPHLFSVAAEVNFAAGSNDGYTGLRMEADGSFYYYENGIINTTKYGIVNYDGSRFFIANGSIIPNSGLASDGTSWYFLSSGQVADYTGLAEYDGAWFYVNNGILDTNRNGIVTYDGEQFMLAAGRIVTEADGLIQDPVSGIWYFVSAGQVASHYRGLALYDNHWFYVWDGVFQKGSEGWVEHDGASFYVVDGMLV